MRLRGYTRGEEAPRSVPSSSGPPRGNKGGRMAVRYARISCMAGHVAPFGWPPPCRSRHMSRLQRMQHGATPCARHIKPREAAAMANWHGGRPRAARCGARMVVAWRKIAMATATRPDVVRTWRWRGGRYGNFAVAPCVSLDVALALRDFYL